MFYLKRAGKHYLVGFFAFHFEMSCLCENCRTVCISVVFASKGSCTKGNPKRRTITGPNAESGEEKTHSGVSVDTVPSPLLEELEICPC